MYACTISAPTSTPTPDAAAATTAASANAFTVTATAVLLQLLLNPKPLLLYHRCSPGMQFFQSWMTQAVKGEVLLFEGRDIDLII